MEDLKPFYNSTGSEYRGEASGTVYKHKDIEYYYKAIKPDKYADNLNGYIPVYSVGIYLLSLDEIEPAFKVMYNVKD